MEDNSKVFKSNIARLESQQKKIEDISNIFKTNIAREESQEGKIEDVSNIFNSNITRVESQQKNNLYDLLYVVPATPIPVHREENDFPCSFIPKNDKCYIPKKISKLKVRTVRDIRSVFEKDTYNYLNDDIEKQQNFLLHKIRGGSSNNESTKAQAKKILESEHPLSRSSWQMLSYINPNKFLNPKQYVIWQGKLIQICGSKGGKSKIVFNYDKSNRKSPKALNTVKTKQMKSKGLLQNSLAVKFKPGPLRRKKFLDESHQRYHLGQIELIDIPRPALEVKPAYGVVLDPFVSNLLNTLREHNGLVTEKWSEFAVSVLGKIDKKRIVQANEECSITFDLKYSRDKKRILMRQDIENVTCDINKTTFDSNLVNNVTTDLEVKNIINDILNSVEISLMQDAMYCKEDDLLPVCNEPSLNMHVNVKEKSKKKYSELDRLDVTVIKLPESKSSIALPCKKSFCHLGCICDSLNQPFRLKQHCGNLDCMFGCKCEKSKYRDIELFDSDTSDLIPGLLNLDKAINSGLAKEEQKFHQTVILSGQKSILLKGQKRNRKFTKRYADFYGNTADNMKRKRILKIVENKFNCANIEPWCMVHNLYRCFCKGKFTESSFSFKPDIDQGMSNQVNQTTFCEDKISNEDRNSLDNNKVRDGPRLRTRFERKVSDKNEDQDMLRMISTCARTNVYKGRKYSDYYYKNMNNKILEMEKNDIKMQKKIIKLANHLEENSLKSSESSNQETSLLEDSISIDNNNSNTSESASKRSESAVKKSPNAVEKNNKLQAWLESSYKIYKERLERGIVKSSLDVPRKGKMALHTWEFILSRYLERKNHFMVSKEKPNRIFLAVNENKSFFDGCINIDDIRFADLNNYPLIVRNLLTNVTDLKNTFCILSGWDFCWELIGSVTKKCEPNTPNEKHIFETERLVSDESNQVDESTEKDSEISDCAQENDNNIPLSDQSERSKWFLMTIENDFTEIRFYNKGFYVKHESIKQAINVARASGKTVRLSSQVCGEKNSSPQFGIYATPHTNQLCVFVGPYELHEQLGLETMKNPVTRKGKKTRGVWVITNKIDNMQVINDPLSFMPTKIEQNEIIVTNGSSTDPADDPSTPLISENIEENSGQTKPNNKPIVKPIRIRRTNGFYHLSSHSLLRQLPQYRSSIFQGGMLRSMLINSDPALLQKDNAENTGVSGIKITSVYSEKKLDDTDIKKPDKSSGMFILKPDEINKKVLETPSQHGSQEGASDISNSKGVDTINYGASSSSTDPNNDVLCISDDDNNDDDNDTNMNCKDIWIQIPNITKLGWIVGMQNNQNKISFLLPGSEQYSDFYPKQEAFVKITQFLVNKNYISKQQYVEFEVVDTLDKVKGNPLSSLRKNLSQIPNTIEAMEETSKLLEDESLLLWIEARSKESEIKTCLKIPESVSSEMTEELQSMMRDLESDSLDGGSKDDDESASH